MLYWTAAGMTMEERQSSAFSSAAPLLKDLPSAPLTQRATEILRLAKLIESREAEAEAQASQRAHSDGSRSSSIDGEAGQEYQPQWTHFARREIQRLAEGLVAEAVGPLDYTLGVAGEDLSARPNFRTSQPQSKRLVGALTTAFRLYHANRIISRVPIVAPRCKTWHPRHPRRG